MAAPRTKRRRQPSARGAPLPTLEDVANLAGVSTATVSRCLNTPERVQEGTRTRVLAVVKELGYAPNFGARALAAKRTNTIGAIVPTIENSIFARGLQAFQEELVLRGETLLVASSSYQPEREEEQIRTLVARGADALLLIGHDRDQEVYDFLDRRGVPYIVTWAFDPDSHRLSIGFDNRSSMKALATTVLDSGHRKLAMITARREGNDRARARVQGVLDAMRERGLPEAGLSLVETEYSIENGAAAFEELMRCTPRPTAVMCGNDVMAAGALSMARDLGLRVPEDVSITGFDDIELAKIVTPRLTTVHVPHREMGRRAAGVLMAMLNGERPESSIELKANVVLRETLGSAP